MKKYIIAFFVVVIAGLGFWKFSEEKEVAVGDKPIIKIGVVLPLTGPVMEIGEITQQAVFMAKNDLKLEKLKNNYEIIIEDADSLSITKTNAALRKLVNHDKINAVLTCLPTAGNVGAEVVRGTHIIHINWGDDHTTIIKPNDFRYYAYVPEQAEMLLAFLKKEGKQNIAILAGNNAYGALATKDVLEKAKAMNMDVVESIKVNLGERDFRLIFQKIEKKNPDIYFLLIDKPDIEIARKQMLEIGINKPVTTIDVFDFVNDPTLFEGMTYVTAFAGKEEFLKRYQEFSKLDNSFGSTFLYDMINIIVQTFEAKEKNETAVQSIARIKEYNGANGKVLQKDNYFKAKSILRRIVNGKPVMVE